MALWPTISWALLFLFVDLLNMVSGYCSNNDELSITRCAQPLYDVGVFGTDVDAQSFSWNLFQTNDPDYFRRVCDAFVGFDLCVDAYKEQCFDQEPIKSQYQTVASLLDYLCHEGYRDTLNNFQCIVSIISDAPMKQCHDSMTRHIRDEVGQSEDWEKGNRSCKLVRDYLRCMRGHIVRRCGLSAWSVVHQIVQRPSALVMPDCRLGAHVFAPSVLLIAVLCTLSRIMFG